MRRIAVIAVFEIILLSVLSACDTNNSNEENGSDGGQGEDTASEGQCDGDDPALERPEGWGKLSHCSGVEPDYEKLFRDDVVHRFDITIGSEDYQATLDDLADKLSGGGPGGGPPGGDMDSDEDPIFVPVTLEFDGLTWWHVGMRYKGNSSLRSAWQSGTRKLAIRLNFEMYDTQYLEVTNQRFYGFEKMTFSNAFKDDSLIRDKVAAEIFREGGIPVARSAFARIYIDYGEGPVYFGLYTMIEDPSNKMLDTQFDDDNGNLYKPEGDGAKWGTYVEEHFDKKTNWTNPDFSDVEAAFDALHADRSDAASWRTGLEEVFDVDGFLKCLAINQAMENWDSYGFMSHNYYIYADPSDGGRFTWFPWDLNEAMLERNVDGQDSGSVLLDEITDDWPMIRYLLDDDVYLDTYKAELQAALEGSFAIDKVHAKMDTYHALIAPYVVGPESEEKTPYTFLGSADDFNNSLTTGQNALKPHVEARHTAVKEALGL